MKAFPRPFSGQNAQSQEGMDLRDYFAAKAMAHWLSFPLGQDQLAIVAKNAYAIADAMMKAREQL